MKNVTILYFAAVRELAGTATEELSLPAEVGTVDDFVAYLERRKQALRGALGKVRVARNEVFAERGERIESGDVLALIPPVQGG